MRRIGILVSSILLLNGFVAPVANADPGRTIYVRPDSTSANVITGTSCLDPNYAGTNGLKSAITAAIADDTIVLCNAALYGNSPNNRTFTLSNTTISVGITFESEIDNPLRRPVILSNNLVVNTDPASTTSFMNMNFVNSLASGSGTDCSATAACGGAIKVLSGTLSLDRMLFTENSAAYGGAIALASGNGSASLEVDRSTFILNTATNNGGAIFVSEEDNAIITNSVFYENSATSGNGAVVYSPAGNVVLNFNTIVNNTGGNVIAGAGVFLKNSILGQRLLDDKLCATNVNIGSGNFITDDSCGSLPEYENGMEDLSVHIPFGQMRIGRIYEPTSGGLQYFRVLSDSPVVDYINFDSESDPSTSIASLNSNRPYQNPDVEIDRADVGAVEVGANQLLVREFTSELTYSGLIIAEKLSVGGTMIPTTTARIMTPTLTYDITAKRIDDKGTAIITTQERHDITVGMEIQVSGVGSGLNGAHRVTAVSAHTFSFATSESELNQTTVSPWGQAIYLQKARITYTSLTPDVCTLVSAKNPAIIPQANSGVCEIEIYSPASNGYEEVYEFVSLQMLIQNKSSKPLNVSVSNITKNSVKVKWERPFTTGKAKLLRYEVSFYRQSKPKEVRLTVKVSPYKLSATISNKLAVNMPYIVRVRAITAAGASAPSTNVLFKTKKK